MLFAAPRGRLRGYTAPRPAAFGAPAIADKTIADLKKSVDVVVSVVKHYSADAAARLSKLLAPVLEEGEELPDYELDQKLKARLLMRLWTELDEVDAAFEEQRVEQKRIREKREELRQDVYDKLLSLRRTLRGIVDKKVAQRGWLRGGLSRDWLKLEREAGFALEELRRMKRRQTAEGLDFDPVAWAKALGREADALKATNSNVELAHKQGESQASARRRALRDYGNRFVEIAGELTQLYGLAGLDDAARLTQPSKKYPGRTQAEIRQLGKAKSTKKSRTPSAGPGTS